MKGASDSMLESIVKEWAASRPVQVLVLSETKGGPQSLLVTPRKGGAVSMKLWVADDGKHVACPIGGGSWWDQAVPLERPSVLELLSPDGLRPRVILSV